jgi:S-adenosylmethionine decarboxylase
MIFPALMFLCGLLTKFTDNLVDQAYNPKQHWVVYAGGLGYGLAAGYLLASSKEFATAILAITIGVLLAGKIDARPHQLAIAAIFAFIAVFGLPGVSLVLVAVFAGLGLLDEFLNDFMDRLKEKRKANKALQRLVSARLSLEAGAIAAGLATGNWNYFLAVFSFDLAYNIADKSMPFLVPSFDSGYGPQLSLDLYKCSRKRLSDKAFLEKVLQDFPKKIGMTPISRPFVLEHNPPKEEDSGLSGFVIIAESHVAIHTYPVKGLAKIDIVSCKAFDAEKALSLMKKSFLAQEAEKHEIERGRHYPKSAEKAVPILKKERRLKQD